jgi:transposase-like protein
VGGPVRTDPEVPEKAQRRRFSEEYKLRIVEAADRCRNPGEVGALLRREGLYSSLLSIWRQQRRDGALDALRSRKRGPKPRRSAESWQIEQLERENVRLREELRKAEVIIEVQKKVSRLLSNLETDDDNGGRI